MASEVVLKIFDELKALHEAKDADYAGGEPLSNFRRCEQFGVPAWKGALIRMSDKWSRLVSLAQKDGEHAVVGEGLEDTLKDLAVYAVIVMALMQRGRWPGEPDAADIEDPDSGISKGESDGIIRTQAECGRRWYEYKGG